MVGSVLHQTSAAALQVGVETSVKSVSATTWKKGHHSYYMLCCQNLILAAVCNPPCENGGRCTSPGRCECTSNYRGSRCQDGMCFDLPLHSHFLIANLVLLFPSPLSFSQLFVFHLVWMEESAWAMDHVSAPMGGQESNVNRVIALDKPGV